MTGKIAQERPWTADRIADGILTWHMWPGFQGTWCRVCECEMNVQGMSYDHWCPECEEKAKKKDPDFRHYVMCSMHNEGLMPHERPKFGPTRRTILAGGERAMEISESRRKFAVGSRVLIQKDSCRYSSGPKAGTVVKLEKSSWVGVRWYRVDLDNGQELQFVYESDMFPGPVMACARTALVGPNPKCRWCKGAGEVDLATTTKEGLSQAAGFPAQHRRQGQPRRFRPS